MNIFNKASKIIKAAVDAAGTPESFDKGQEFEEYVKNYLFPKELYDLMHHSHEFSKNKDRYVESSLNPDFKFRSKETKQIFWIEAKFRSSVYNQKVEWCKNHQIKRYAEINKETTVFLVLGVGGIPSNPEHIYVVPIKYAKYTKLFVTLLRKYEFNKKMSMNPHNLWRLL